MSGIGGGGAMVLYRARDNRYEVIDYGMSAPNSLRAEDYPLTGEGAAGEDDQRAVWSGLLQADWLHPSRRWGAAAQYTYFTRRAATPATQQSAAAGNI